MWRNKEQGSDKYLKGKKRARAGLLLGFILWFVGFVVIGGEWFFMWQSSDWNGMDVAIKNAILFVLVLLYLEMKEA
jgi:predicted small integral membrane protein